MAEAKLEIRQNGEYNNLELKTKFERNGKVLKFDEKGEKIVKIQGIPNGDHIIVEKVMADGKEIVGKFGTSFTCKVKYQDVECSFFLTVKEHERYAACGGEGDKVKITLKEEVMVNRINGSKTDIQALYFEKVE